MAEQPTYTVSKETLRRLATEMAGLQLSDAELEQLTPQMAALLADLSALEDLDLSQIEPAVTFTPLEIPGHGH